MSLRGVLVGFGAVAENAHAPAYRLQDDLRIDALVESQPARRRAAAASFPKARLYESLDACLRAESGLDFADIATPPFLHAEQAGACLERGLHVLCEKPLAVDAGEVARLRRIAEDKDRALFCVHNWKHAPALASLLELARGGAVGEVAHVEFHALRDKPAAAAGASWRTDLRAAGGGIVVDHGWHAFYLIHALCGGEPLGRIESALRLGPSGADEEAVLMLEAGAATAVVRLSWHAPSRANWAIVHGRAGTLELRDDVLLASTGGGDERLTRFPERLSAGSAHPEWFAATLGGFVSAVAGGPERRQNLEESSFCAQAVAGAYGRAPVSAPALAAAG